MKYLLQLIIASLLLASCSSISTSQRYLQTQDGIIYDTKTKLMWAKSSLSEPLHRIDAMKYCFDYNQGGYRDWRMPTQDELASIFDYYNSLRTRASDYIDVKSSKLWAIDEDPSEQFGAYFDLEFYSSYYVSKKSGFMAGVIPVRYSNSHFAKKSRKKRINLYQ